MENDRPDARRPNLTLLVMGGAALLVACLAVNSWRLKQERVAGLKSPDRVGYSRSATGPPGRSERGGLGAMSGPP